MTNFIQYTNKIVNALSETSACVCMRGAKVCMYMQ
jgi:hypothetical protein